MTGRVLAGVALRVWGVMLLVGALAQLPQWVMMTTLPPATDPNAAMMRASEIGLILSVVARALVGLAVLVFAGRLAAAIVPDSEPLVIDVDAPELTMLAFAVAGVVILVWGLMDVGAVLFTLALKPDYESWTRQLWTLQRDAIVRAPLEAAAGVVLVFGRRGIAAAWWRLRGRELEDTGDLP